MLLKMFYDDRLAQASYIVGCPGAGEATIIDPARDITPYLEIAEKEGLQITGVTETHIHADFVSGIHELAAATGATVYLSAMGDENWQYDFPDSQMTVSLLNEGDNIMIGNVKLTAMHTPGHTPEHISFILTDTAVTVEPMAIFTGDFLFVGNVGRPDLLEASAGMIGTAEIGARQQFATIERFRDLPEYLQILP
ncbi:MAG: MBL fold metallo-hydrolase, partial [Aggregatilineales bacterium]